MTTQPVNKGDIQALLHNYSVEITPKAASAIGDFSRWLKQGTHVYVTFLPGSAVEQTLATCRILKNQGMRPVPHLALRSIESEAQLRWVFDYLGDLSIDETLLIAGAVRYPKGPYHSVQRLLQDGLLEEYTLRGIAFAGHPEGTPDISPEDVRYAEVVKQNYANKHPREYWFVSQFCFAAEPVIAWQQQLLLRNVHLPLRIGVAGLATIGTLIKHAKACGVGPSMAYLLKNSRGMRHLMTTSTPDGLIHDLAAYCANEAGQRIAGLHFYPLGGFEATMKWIHAIEAGDFDLTEGGFRVH